MTNSRAKPNLQIVIKKTDETVNNSTTLQNDDELFLTLKVNKTYYFSLIVFVNSSAVADFKYKMTIPSGATAIKGTAAHTPAFGSTASVTTESSPSTDGNDQVATHSGRIIMGSTPGNITLQWAQANLEVSNTKVLIGSTLKVYEQP